MSENQENGAIMMPRVSTMLYDCVRNSRSQRERVNNDTMPVTCRGSSHNGSDINIERSLEHRDRLIDVIRGIPPEVTQRLLTQRREIGNEETSSKAEEAEMVAANYIDDLQEGKTDFKTVCDELTKKIGRILFEEFEKEDKSRPLIGQATHLLDVLASLARCDGGNDSDMDVHGQNACRKFQNDSAKLYFLHPEAIEEVLTIEVDSEVLQGNKVQKGPGKGRGKKRKDDIGERKVVNRIVDYDLIKWNSKMQGQLCQLITCILGREPLEKFEHTMSSNMYRAANKLRLSGACRGMQLIGATLEEVCNALDIGGFLDPDEFLSEVEASCKEAAETYLLTDKPSIRRGKIVGYADAFVSIINELLIDMLGLAKPKRGKAKGSKIIYEYYAEEEDPDKPKVKLPDSIAFNREPFRHGAWRKTPFKPRPYVRLESYNIVEDFVREEISEKLKTGKVGNCNGEHCKQRKTLGQYSLENDRFISGCSCLSRNMECSEECACDASTCLNREVSRRNAVKIGLDVEEINSWGMDCYTRKNIQDAIMESQAFGHFDIPKYDDKVTKPSIAATSAGQHAAVAADVPSPKSVGTICVSEDCTKQQVLDNSVQRAASEWIELVLMPAINKQGAHGWDLGCALEDILVKSEKEGDDVSLKAAEAIKKRLSEVGSIYFRLHPKGVGLVCKREEGIPPLTFIEEYLGEIHTPWRWFELQDAVKKITGSELPDFYNIVLERPKDDPAGYDVLFVDAAAKGAVASRMSHSCTPNCQAVVMACNGRLTIALYTLRQVHPGEELTFDYSSVTESEKEFKQAICLCGTHMCRGSYLYFTGSKAFMQILASKHNILHRQVTLIRSVTEPLNQTDADRLEKFGLGSSCLGSHANGSRVPEWLEKWTSLICEYLEQEEKCLRDEFLNKEPYKGRYTEAAAAAEAKGVIANRIQNIAITLDKVRMVLKQPNQTSDPPLRVLKDEEICDHLWNGPKSIARRLLRGSVHIVAPDAALQINDTFKLAALLKKDSGKLKQILPDSIHQLAAMINKPASSPQEAREKLVIFCDLLREMDNELGGGLTAASDAGIMYAFTSNWVTSAQGYKTFTSPKVPINLEDLFLNREEEQDEPIEHARLLSSAQNLAKTHANNPALKKVYRPTYVWGQLSGWFKQTVNDPTASLSADRRGAISLPDIESAFKTGSNYIQRDRKDMLDHLSSKPDGMWKTGTLWQFKNESKYYGTPMLDQAWYQVTGKGYDPMPQLLEKLKYAKIPSQSASRSSAQEIATNGHTQRRGKGHSSLSDIYVLD